MLQTKAFSLAWGYILNVRKDNPNLSRNNIVGKTNEYLGSILVREMHGISKQTIIPEELINKLLPETNKNYQTSAWELAFPDGIILRRMAKGKYKIIRFVEYKVPNMLHMDETINQFEKFFNLAEYFKSENSKNNNAVLNKILLPMRVEKLIIPDDFRIMYVVPDNKDILKLPKKDKFEVIKLPISSGALHRMIEKQKKQEKNKAS